MDKIPKKFKLFGTTYNVEFNTEKMNNESSLGFAEYTKALITLTRTYKGEALAGDVVIDTYYHEKVHMILDAMGENDLSSNEKFVEVFSRLLRQLDDTSEY